MPIFIDYQALLKEKVPYERSVPNDHSVPVCAPSGWTPKAMSTDMPTMLPESHLGVMAVLSDGGKLVPILTASDLLRKLKALWNEPQE